MTERPTVMKLALIYPFFVILFPLFASSTTLVLSTERKEKREKMITQIEVSFFPKKFPSLIIAETRSDYTYMEVHQYNGFCPDCHSEELSCTSSSFRLLLTSFPIIELG